MERADGVRCRYICLGKLPQWLSVNQTDIYGKRKRRETDEQNEYS